MARPRLKIGVKPYSNRKVRKGRIRKAMYSLLVAVMALAALELAVALAQRIAHGTWFRDGQPCGLYMDSEDAGFGGLLGLRPGARLDGLLYDVSVNSMGCRGAEPLVPRPADGLRVWCAGGSTTFDIYARDDESTWPARVGRLLREALPHRTVEVLNAGVPGVDIRRSRVDFVAHVTTYAPDVLVVYHGPNDLRSASATAGGTPWIFFQSATARVMSEWLSTFGPVKGSWRGRRVSAEQIEGIGADLEFLVVEARRFGVDVVLATHALRADPEATGWRARRQVAEAVVLMNLDPEGVVHAYDSYNGLVRQRAQQWGLPVADVQAAIPADRRYWGDATHFSAEGSELAARVIAETILESGAWERDRLKDAETTRSHAR